jgi:hypothetical protein
MTPVYAYFLPQFYSTPENDKFWGEGFTEWTNVRNAKPLFKGHRRPLLPQNDDFYDLSDPETANRVINHTQEIGLDAVAYWYYWFGDGKRTLEKVPEIHLETTDQDQSFFFAWANAPWTKAWVGNKKEVIFEQVYDLNDVDAHIDDLLPYLEDSRYERLDGKPLYQLNNPAAKGVIPYVLKLHERLQKRTGIELAWLFPSFVMPDELLTLPHYRIGFPPEDVQNQDNTFKRRKQLTSLNPWKKPVVTKLDKYSELMKIHLLENRQYPNFAPTLLSGWDTTYRYKKSGSIIAGTVEEHISAQMNCVREILNADNPPFILIKAYNEWAEGNILENHMFDGKLYDISTLIRDEIKSTL